MIDFNSDYERNVFSEAYNEGKRDERKRILKLIDEKIEGVENRWRRWDLPIFNTHKRAFQEIKEELQK